MVLSFWGEGVRVEGKKKERGLGPGKRSRKPESGLKKRGGKGEKKGMLSRGARFCVRQGERQRGKRTNKQREEGRKDAVDTARAGG